MESFEYAIKKDVRNNPIVREVDETKQRELWKWAGIAAFLVMVLLIETLRAPQRIEALATERLHLTEPAADQAVVIERVAPVEPPARSVVAQR